MKNPLLNHKEENKVDVSVIVVNWNGKNTIVRCLESIKNRDDQLQVEIILVDNASTDGSPDLVKELIPDITILYNSENLGFAAANNEGILRSRGRYVLLINNDAWLEKDTLRELVNYADRHPWIGIMGPRVNTPDGFLQPTYSATPSFVNILFPDREFKQKADILSWGTDEIIRRQASEEFIAKYGYDAIHPVENISGVCMLVRQEMIRQVGLLDEGYFMYYEDLDWCVRARKKSWQVYYYPEVTVTHAYQKLKEKKQPEKLQTEIRKSQMRFLRKHSGSLAMMLIGCISMLRLFFVLLGLRIALFFGQKKKRKEINRTLFQIGNLRTILSIKAWDFNK